MKTIQVTRFAKVTEQISIDDIKPMLIEARIWEDEIDAYADVFATDKGMGLLVRAFTIPCPEHLVHSNQEEILEYAKENIPENLTHINLT